MNAIFFGLKRAYYASLVGSRALTRHHDLTPARFDLMYLIDTRGPYVHQSTLWRSLGVSRATTSRMLCALETLGLIRRERGDYDTRQRIVTLTQKGRQLIKSAIRRIIGSGIAELMMESASAIHGYARSAVEGSVGTFERHLEVVQQTFAQRSVALYFFTPYDPLGAADG